MDTFSSLRLTLSAELFDFIPEEGTGVTHFDIDNFDQVLARLTGEIGEDVNSIVLPPILSFSHANLPFEARDLRTSIKVGKGRLFPLWAYFLLCHTVDLGQPFSIKTN